jgi:hypothetical protein
MLQSPQGAGIIGMTSERQDFSPPKAGGTSTAASETVKPEAAGRIWAMATMYGVFGMAFLFLLVLLPGKEILQTVFMAFFTVLLFAGMGISLMTVYRMGSAEPVANTGDFVCKHCGKRFSSRKACEGHQKSCAEMRL